jgi:hypothetical protein
MAVAKLILPAPPLDSAILPLLTAAAAVGKLCGVVIPRTGTSNEPNNAATNTRITCERNPSRNFFVLKGNMLNTRPLVPYMDGVSNLEKVCHI